MKFSEFISEDQILEEADLMLEMANLHYDDTGIPYVMWLGEVGGQHGPRIKVSNVKGKFQTNNYFVITVDKDPSVVTPKSMHLPPMELQNIIDWIMLNYDCLMRLWDMYESGSGSIAKELQNLKKIADGRSFSWAKWNWKREKEVDKLVNQAIITAVALKQDIICSDLNLSESRRIALIAKLEGVGYEVEIKEFPVTLEEAWKRDAARENGVGHSVIAEQYQKWLKYKGRKMYEPKKHLPKCILVDVDGTLAHMNGKRGAFEWDKVGVDDVDPTVKMIVRLYGNQPDTNVIIYLDVTISAVNKLKNG